MAVGRFECSASRPLTHNLTSSNYRVCPTTPPPLFSNLTSRFPSSQVLIALCFIYPKGQAAVVPVAGADASTPDANQIDSNATDPACGSAATADAKCGTCCGTCGCTMPAGAVASHCSACIGVEKASLLEACGNHSHAGSDGASRVSDDTNQRDVVPAASFSLPK